MVATQDTGNPRTSDAGGSRERVALSGLPNRSHRVVVTGNTCRTSSCPNRLLRSPLLGVHRPAEIGAGAADAVPRRAVPAGVGHRPGVAVDADRRRHVRARGLGRPVRVPHHRPVEELDVAVRDGDRPGQGTRARRRTARSPRCRGATGPVVVEVTDPELPGHARLIGVRGDDDRRGRRGVGDPRAAIVDPVEGDLRHAGVDRRAGVVAVGAGSGVPAGHRARRRRAGGRAVAVAVRVEVVGGGRETVVHHPVAVVVHRVAGLGRGGVNRRARVVAVGGVRHPPGRGRAGGGGVGRVPVAVAVRVPVERGHHALVDAAIAVVVDAVAGLHGAVEHGGVGVVAVGRVHLAVPVAVRVRVRGVAAEAVLVDAVRGHVGGAGVDPVVLVVAVGAGGDARHRGVVAVAVAVRVRLAHQHGVGPRGTREGVRVAVVAVGPVRDVAGGRFARRDRVGGVPEGVLVVVRVPGGGVHGLVVDHGVAVLVDAVAGLDGPGLDRAVEIVAVPGHRGLARLHAAGEEGGAGAVAVAIEVGVDRLARTTDAGVRVVAVAVDGGEAGALTDAALHAGRARAVAVAVRVDVGLRLRVADHGVGGRAVVGRDLVRRGDLVPALAGVTGGEAEAGRRGPVEGIRAVHGVGVVAVRVRTVRVARVGAERIDALLDARAGGHGLRGRDGVAGGVLHLEGVGRVGVVGAAGDREDADQGEEHEGSQGHGVISEDR